MNNNANTGFPTTLVSESLKCFGKHHHQIDWRHEDRLNFKHLTLLTGLMNPVHLRRKKIRLMREVKLSADVTKDTEKKDRNFDPNHGAD